MDKNLPKNAGAATNAGEISHTPAPWFFDRDSGRILDGAGCVVATLRVRALPVGRHPMDAADGQVLAPAPKLLAALRACLSVLPYGNESIDLMAFAAIAQAEGRAP